MAVSLLIMCATAVGLGGFLPSAGYGVRAFVGWATIPLLLFVLSDLASLPLGRSAWIVAGLAAVGIGVAVREGIRRGLERGARAAVRLHPVVLCAVSATVAAALWGPERYQPLNWDELGTWLSVPRQMYVADAVWHPEMIFATPGYTQGWYLSMLYPNMFQARFGEVHALAAGSAGWICFIGLLWDAIRSAGDSGGRDLSGVGLRAVLVTAFAVLLPVAWIPQTALIEYPQFLLTEAPLVLLALTPATGRESRALAWALGLVLAAGYYLKIAGILMAVLIPLAWWQGRRFGPWHHAAALSLPLAAVYLAWSGFANPGGVAESCFTGVLSMLDYREIADSATILPNYADRSLAFLGSWIATPWAAMGVLGLVLAAWRAQTRWVTVGAVAYGAVYVAALGWSYLTCFDAQEQMFMGSLGRYQGLALDVMAAGGVAVLAQGLMRVLAPPTARLLPSWRSAVPVPAMLVAAGITAAVVIGLRAVPRLEDPFGPGHPFPPAFVEKRLPLMLGFDELRQLAQVTVTGNGLPTATVVAQNTDGFERIFLLYLSIGERRGDPLFRFRVFGRHSWTPVTQVWSQNATQEQAAADLRRAEIIWPRHIDSYIGSVLAGFADSDVCRDNIRAFFLWRSDPGAPYRCVLSEGMVTYFQQQDAARRGETGSP